MSNYQLNKSLQMCIIMRKSIWRNQQVAAISSVKCYILLCKILASFIVLFLSVVEQTLTQKVLKINSSYPVVPLYLVMIAQAQIRLLIIYCRNSVN